jgi:hypothetical protein
MIRASLALFSRLWDWRDAVFAKHLDDSIRALGMEVQLILLPMPRVSSER